MQISVFLVSNSNFGSISAEYQSQGYQCCMPTLSPISTVCQIYVLSVRHARYQLSVLHALTKVVKILLVFTENSMERKHGALRPQKPLRLIRDGEVGGSGILYLTPTRHTVTTRMLLH